MDYKTSQKLFSVARTNKYTYACANNKRKAMLLYRYNIRLCQRFFGVLNYCLQWRNWRNCCNIPKIKTYY